uniref:Uncharacterized protein n=1 Tax=Echeneis naucrates TaxID=173247 RepID=A0A665V9B5_ECHNA
MSCISGYSQSDLMAYPEVIRIHMQLLRVHHAQLGVGALDVVHVLHGIFQPTHHCLSMCGHFSVSHDGKVSLSPGVHNQKPEKIQKNTSPGQGLGSNFTHIYLPPQGTDGLALSICPLDHGEDVKVSSICSFFKTLITNL